MLTSRQDARESAAAFRARTAAASVQFRFGHRLWGIPLTHIAAVHDPRERTGSPWHYWWQAHYLDCLIDAALRESTVSGDRVAHGSILLARRLVRGIHLRNGLRWRNSYYDDMAWLALAVDRLSRLGGRSGRALAALEQALRSAHTGHLGGGLFWNTARDFKNTPATGPAALFFARRGDHAKGQELVDWLGERLLDERTGLYLDGIRVTSGAEVLVPAVYTYNQGPVLGALLELGGSGNSAAAADLVSAIGSQLATDGVLQTHGAGDGGLFTGILARYLALAALSPALPDAARRTAALLVTATADTLWSGAEIQGADQRHTPRGRRRPVPVAAFPAGTGDPAGLAGDQLSTQLQAWLILEAAYRVTAGATRDAAAAADPG